MKTSAFLFILIAGSFFSNQVKAQSTQNLRNNNMDMQPSWGPSGYEHVDYYYLPAIKAYYSVAQQEFTYLKAGAWVSSETVPAAYSGINLYRAHKVVLNEEEPYLRNHIHKTEFAALAAVHDQPVIRDSKDARYAQEIGVDGGDKSDYTQQVGK